MKLTVDIRVARDWNDVPVQVEIAEEIVGGDFADQTGADAVNAAIERISAEVIGKAKTQVERRLTVEMSKQLADERAARLEEVL